MTAGTLVGDSPSPTGEGYPEGGVRCATRGAKGWELGSELLLNLARFGEPA
jgi:hypothetical protein